MSSYLSPGSLARAAYAIALAVVVTLLLAPGRSHGQQFRGIPAGMFPFFPTFGGGFTGFAHPTFMPFPAAPFYTMPGPSLLFPMFNFPDSTAFFNPFLAFFGGFGGFTSFRFGMFGTPFGFQGFSSFGFGNGLGFGGFTSGFGFNGFGFGGFGGFGIGGFAGKGFGGFNGKNGL